MELFLSLFLSLFFVCLVIAGVWLILTNFHFAVIFLLIAILLAVSLK